MIDQASPLMRQHRILITGADGFVGTWLMRLLRDYAKTRPIELITAGRSDNSDYSLDVVDRLNTYRIVHEVQPTAVIHLAAIAAPIEARRDPSTAWNVNFQGTLNMASSVLSAAPNSKFIYASSSEVYGVTFEENNGRPVDERSLLQPKNMYGAAKAAADIAVGQMFYDGLRSIRFRPFNHTGPGQTPSFVVSAFAKQVADIMQGRIKPIIKVGNLDAFRDFLDVRDVVHAYATAALSESKDAEGKVFNLASGRTIQIREILDILIRLSGHDIEVIVDPEKVRPLEVAVAIGNADAAKRTFNWSPTVSIEKTITDVLDQWKHIQI
ncbi:GDP-mannose 4,6-dehydratase [Brucella sp. 6810]|uniref:GDP-mannose 4,6-dehydratase n=1 Tax=Brucella sp. 6810 TaxID=2769351 RepID=UPI00165AE719|nr:GDP-mannose 4,6-dehydratase [Brucella sp. 6810]QNQ62040.1 GDP-mannose 4,6-dehydratase [Brucella sp. 6810]